MSIALNTALPYVSATMVAFSLVLQFLNLCYTVAAHRMRNRASATDDYGTRAAAAAETSEGYVPLSEHEVGQMVDIRPPLLDTAKALLAAHNQTPQEVEALAHRVVDTTYAVCIDANKEGRKAGHDWHALLYKELLQQVMQTLETAKSSDQLRSLTQTHELPQPHTTQ